MTYFSRLTDIVTCNLTDLLKQADDPIATLDEIVLEMEEGLAGARRSVNTAANNAERLRGEIDTHRNQVAIWKESARQAVVGGREDEARIALSRKQELEDVAAGLEQEYGAAVATRDHLETTLRALQARLTDARRKRAELTGEPAPPELASPYAAPEPLGGRNRAIEDELAALKRELGTA
ncbi:MAG: PspA/IM30 family protein [Planctomycetota bacterium]|nr:PspA/IM30 family protein [Planctomycetaceae bacterium]MDQ3332885.1 PspA/IM30 family protein [Planctomycetota bacterium]